MFPAYSACSSSSPASIMAAAWSRVRKWYSTPSVSPGRGGRVVTDVDTHTSGCRRRTAASTASLPTPDGPDSTVKRPSAVPGGSGRCGTGSSMTSGIRSTELTLERHALLRAETADAAGRRDLQPLHDPGRAGLADAG